MTTPNDVIISRIQKLLALSENNNNLNEAQSAAKKASELLAEYNLSMETIRDIQTDTNDVIGKNILGTDNRNIKNWKATLAYVLAKYNFAKSIINGKNFTIVGKPINTDVVIFLYNNLSWRFTIIANSEFQKYKLSGGDTHGRAWKNSFLVGAVTGLNSKLQEQRIEFSHKPGGRELLDLRKNEIDIYIATSMGKIIKHKSNVRINDGYGKGYITGRSIEIQRPIENKTTPLFLK